MTSSVESTFEGRPDPNDRNEFARLDPEKTVIRQGEPLAAPEITDVPQRSLSPVGFRNSTSHLIGQKLDHFLIESLVGSGGMGSVFRGRDTKLEREVAVKVVPIADRDAEAMRRFRFEAQSAAKLDHPNIARVYYVGETEHWSYIVFEFVEGTNLRELVVKKGLLSIDDAVCLTRQVAEALQHAFERKVVHRDIKPSNILVTQSGQAKLVDMGLARTTELENSSNDLTASGVTLGTFDYISPEQAHDPRQADVRSDVYSLGCTLYFLLTGQPPFPVGTAIQKLLMHGTKMPEDPRLFRSDISDSMIAILRKMMAKRPSDRYQVPTDLIHDLRTLAELEGLVWASSSDKNTNLPAVAQRTWIEAALPLVVSLAAIFGITLWLQSSSFLSATFPIPPVDYSEALLPPSESALLSDTVDRTLKQSEPGELASPNNKAISENQIKNTVDTSHMQKTLQPADEAVRELDTIIVDSEATSENDPFRVRSLDKALELVGSQPHLKTIIVNSGVGSTTFANLKSALAVKTNLTIQGESDERFRWVIDGTEAQADTVSTLAWIECLSNQLALRDIDIVWRVNTMSRRRSLFSVRSNASLQLENCSITVQYDFSTGGSIPSDAAITLSGSLPSVIVVDAGPTENFSDSLGNLPKIPARIGLNEVSIRGQCDWLRMPNPNRTEVQVWNSWLAIAGSMFDLSGSRNGSRSGIPLRVDMRNVTAYSQRAWMRVHLSNSQPFPVPFVRTAKECIFSGSKSLIDWNATDCDDWEVWAQSDEGNELSRWIDLRGTDNVYDALTLSDYLTVRLNDGAQGQIGIGTDSSLVREERGLETISSWKRRPMLDPSSIDETTFERLEWNPGTFRPGYRFTITEP